MTVETFEEAVTRFQRFLLDCGRAQRIVWVEPQDVLLTGTRRIYVRVPVPPDRERRVREVYETVVKLNSGLRMASLAENSEVAYCYLWGRPKDHEKDPQVWPRCGVLMSALETDNRRTAELVHNRLRWTWLSWRLRTQQGLKSLVFT